MRMTTERERVANHDTRKCIAGLRLYIKQEASPVSALDFDQLQSINRTRQGTLDQFLKTN
jgi:hypothetical protein